MKNESYNLIFFFKFIAVQTVGEEYVALLSLVPDRQRGVPVFIRRLIFIFFFAVAPLLIKKFLQKVEESLKNSLTTNETSFFDRKQRNLRQRLLSLVIWIRSHIRVQLFSLFLYNSRKILILW